MAVKLASHPRENSQIQKQGLTWFCAALFFVITAVQLMTLAGIPRFYQRVTAKEVPIVLAGGSPQTSNEKIASNAAARRMSLSTYALYWIGLTLFQFSVFASVAVLVALKANGDWFRWFTALVLMFAPSGMFLWDISLVSQYGFPYVTILTILWPCFLLFLFLFPNGKAVPHWMRWPVGGIVLIHLVLQSAFMLIGFFHLPGNLARFESFAWVISLGLFLILACQVYRYVFISTPLERVQIRWVVAGLVLVMLLSSIFESAAVNVFNDLGYPGDLDNLVMCIIPITIGISVLRYRLWDIDVIIRRTLIYSTLTLLLGLVYLGIVIVLQTVFGRGQSQVAIVISTLAIAALFNPVYRRVQNMIDRRFYRRRYDAVKTLDAFAAKARDEVELNDLVVGLQQAVEETIQPVQLSIWINPEKERK